MTLYRQLFEIYHTTTNKHIKKQAKLLISQFDYGCFDTAFRKEVINLIAKYNNQEQ